MSPVTNVTGKIMTMGRVQIIPKDMCVSAIVTALGTRTIKIGQDSLSMVGTTIPRPARYRWLTAISLSTCIHDFSFINYDCG